MATIATGTESFSPAEVEALHIRLATAASLDDNPNEYTEGIISDILAGRTEPAPLYAVDESSTDNGLRDQISSDDPRVWASVFTAIENGQIDVLDHFISLGFNITRCHPIIQQYP